jgi:Lon protease-like protein
MEPDFPPDPDSLPTVIPVFPLAAPLLLPGTAVPLFIAEPQYRTLIEDALTADSYVGILQPTETSDEEAVGEPGPADSALYSVGCLGYIGEFREEGPDESVALVGGVIRFRVLRELPPVHGYRRVEVDYQEFLDDLSDIEEGLQFLALRDVVRQRIESNQTGLDLSIMDGMEGTEIVTAIAHALPFSAAERQVLMESPSLRELEELLLQLMSGPGGIPHFDLRPLLPS